MSITKIIFYLSIIWIITVSNNIGFAKSFFHTQESETKTNKTNTGLSIVQFYNDTLSLYMGLIVGYSASELPPTLFTILAGNSQKNIKRKSIFFLEDITINYLLAVSSHKIHRSTEMEAILINMILLMNEEDNFNCSINKKIKNNTSIKINIYSDSEMDDIIDSTSDDIPLDLTPMGYFDGLSTYPVCPIDSYTPELILYIYENACYNLKKCADFLNKMKPHDIFFNAHNYYFRKLNSLLLKKQDIIN